MGNYYENQIVTSVTLDDGKTPIPSFMAFDAMTRTLSVSPTSSDLGLYYLSVNYDCLKNPDPDATPSTHEHSSVLEIEVAQHSSSSVVETETETAVDVVPLEEYIIKAPLMFETEFPSEITIQKTEFLEAWTF